MNASQMRRYIKLAAVKLNVSEKEVTRLLYKIAGEFEDAVKDKKFKNPETGNEVKFQSLPAEQQAKIRSQFNKSKKEEGSGEKEKAEKMKDKFNSDPKFRAVVVDKTVKALSGEEVKKQMAERLKKDVKKKDLDNFTDALKKGDAKGFEKSMTGVSKGVMKGVLKTLGAVLGGAAILALGGDPIASAVTDTMDDVKNTRVEELEAENEEMSEGEKENEMITQIEKFREIDPNIQMLEDLMGVYDKELTENFENQQKIEQKMDNMGDEGLKNVKEVQELEKEWTENRERANENKKLKDENATNAWEYSNQVSNLFKYARMSKFSKEDKMNIDMIVGLVQEKLKENIEGLKKNPPKKNTKKKSSFI